MQLGSKFSKKKIQNILQKVRNQLQYNNNKDTSVFVYQKHDTDLDNWQSNFFQKTDCTNCEPDIFHGKQVLSKNRNTFETKI